MIVYVRGWSNAVIVYVRGWSKAVRNHLISLTLPYTLTHPKYQLALLGPRVIVGPKAPGCKPQGSPVKAPSIHRRDDGDATGLGMH